MKHIYLLWKTTPARGWYGRESSRSLVDIYERREDAQAEARKRQANPRGRSFYTVSRRKVVPAP